MCLDLPSGGTAEKGLGLQSPACSPARLPVLDLQGEEKRTRGGAEDRGQRTEDKGQRATRRSRKEFT
ncbi:hypothetical protein EYF80_027771 [Liparis tanakae]|uniref:Uncharacterized protein n=1 Tax=Liparis tanakae TaxID=230148 RepID=A0A4Z2HAJ2_9TELE|nr:hypothetical protein EYF80_027771 [Liparis tanakae]